MNTALFFKFLLLSFFFTAVLLLNLCWGEVQLSIGQILDLIYSSVGNDALKSTAAQILMDIRLPRALSAALVGAALGISGYQLQSLSNNGLADPYLTGVSSGAGLAVAVAVIMGLDAALVPLLSLLGGIAASLVVLFLSKTYKGISVSRLLLAGVAVSAFCGSIITMIICSGMGGTRTQGIYYWLAGSVNGKSWEDLSSAGVYIAAGALLAFLTSKPLRLLSIGADSASSLGVDVAKAQLLVLLSSILLCSSAVSLSGIVGFAGLVAPYLARRFFGRDERAHLFAASAVGASLVLLSDLASRLLSAGQELPLGTLLSLLGAPFFLYLLLKREDGISHL